MKKLILLSTLISLFYIGNAQHDQVIQDSKQENILRLGLHFTPSVGFIQSDKTNVKGGGASIGYNFGLLGDIRFAENYYFSTGIDVVSSPLKVRFIDTLRDPYLSKNDVILNYKLQYLGFPLSLKLKTDEIHYTKFFGQFGVEPQFNISKKVRPNKGTYAGTDYYVPVETAFSNFNDDINFVRISMIIGGGIEYSLGGKTSFVAGINYNGGFTDINKQPALKISNNYIAINLGVLF